MHKNHVIRSAAFVAAAISLVLLTIGSRVAAAQSSVTTAQAARHCDRQCLKDLMDQYLGALVAHDPSRLHTTSDVKFTENTNRMTLGDGLWQTISGLGTFKLYIEDPASGQAAFYGTVKENGVIALLGARLKERDRRVSELETFVIREQTGVHGTFDKLNTADPVWTDALPPAERSSRAQMQHDANQYFNGIVQGDGDIVPFADDFTRIENGQQTAPTPGTSPRAKMDSRAQFNAKVFDYIHQISNRRFLLTDPERGIVYAVVLFQHPGNIDTPLRRSPDGQINPKSLGSYPNTTQIIETFQIRGGKIHRIFAYVSLLPYRQQPGW